jgi:hypothetical protein
MHKPLKRTRERQKLRTEAKYLQHFVHLDEHISADHWQHDLFRAAT